MKRKALFKQRFAWILIVGLASLVTNSVQAQQIKAKITGLKSTKGKIIINVFRDQQSYELQQPDKKFVFDKKGLSGGLLNVSCEIGPGTYGLTVLDDESVNGKMDYNFLGIPKEGFGFSNFFMEKMKKPVFDDFKVNLKVAESITFRLKYM